MEKKLNCCPKLSLEQLALRRVVVNMWNEPEILASIQKCEFISFSTDNSVHEWQETVEGKVIEKILELVLFEPLKKEMVHLVRPMGLDTLRWKIFHEKFLTDPHEFFDVHILEQICRTCTGAINYQKTAEQLVRLEILDIQKRYKLACLYCLADCIPDLWKELPEKLKEIYGNEEDSEPLGNLHMEYYWPLILKGKESKLKQVQKSYINNTFFAYAFHYSAKRGNKVAAEHFYQKLSEEERDSSLFIAVYIVVKSRRIKNRGNLDLPIEKLSEVLCYLFSVMSPEEQMRVLKEHSYDVLGCLLDWPWQHLFFDVIDIMWTFLPESGYGILISLLKTKDLYSEFYFQNFFRDFFLRSPSNFKKYFVCLCGSFFNKFFNAEDTETVKLIFRNVDVEDRKRLISSYAFFGLLDGLLMKDKRHFVELCLREATLSKEDSKRLKEIFMAFINVIESPELISVKTHKWKEFFQSFDETNERTLNKRALMKKC